MRAGLRIGACASGIGVLALLFCGPVPHQVFPGYQNAAIGGGSLVIALAEQQPDICFDAHLLVNEGSELDSSDLLPLFRHQVSRAFKAATPFAPVRFVARPFVNPQWRPHRMRVPRMRCAEGGLSGDALVQRLAAGPAFVLQVDSITQYIPADSTQFKVDSISPDYFIFLQNLSILVGSSEDQTAYSPPARTTTGYYNDDLSLYRPPRTVIYCSASFLLWDNRRQRPVSVGFAEGRAAQDRFSSLYGSGTQSVDGQDPFWSEELLAKSVEAFARKVASLLPLRQGR
jgi:hypothetical protein